MTKGSIMSTARMQRTMTFTVRDRLRGRLVAADSMMLPLMPPL
jgi:hypothetical protein